MYINTSMCLCVNAYLRCICIYAFMYVGMHIYTYMYMCVGPMCIYVDVHSMCIVIALFQNFLNVIPENELATSMPSSNIVFW